MVATILKKNNKHYCSNCRIIQDKLKPTCVFCGNFFSNYEDILIQEDKEQFNLDIMEAQNESNIYGRNREP